MLKPDCESLSMKQDHNAVNQLPLFTAEFAKRQYISLYRVIEAQGHLPAFIYPGILLYIKDRMEKLRLNDDQSILGFLQGLSLCQQYVKMTEKHGSQVEKAHKLIFQANLAAVIQSINMFLLRKDQVLCKTKARLHQECISLPTFTEEMRRVMSYETYVKSDLPLGAGSR